LITATLVVPRTSWSVKSRPRSSLMPKVSKYPGVIMLVKAERSSIVSGAPGRSSARALPLVCTGTDRDADATVTPGSARSRSTSCAYIVSRWSDVSVVP